MTKPLKTELLDLLKYIQNSPPQHPAAKDIGSCIEEMLKCFDGNRLADKDRIEKLTLTLDRLITDDYEFYKSETGVEIAKTVYRILNPN